jgi:hypothetical protein
VQIEPIQKLLSIFLDTKKYFEYLLGHLGYMGEKMFVIQWLGKCELAIKHDLDAM